MKTSMIIPTWNEELFLNRLLTISCDLDKIDELIIADNNSSDQTVNIAKKFGCKIVSGGKPAMARNKGAKASVGEILLFADADIIIPPGVIEETLGTFDNSNIVAVHFRLVPITNNRIHLFYYYAMHFCIQFLSHISINQGLGCFLAVRKGIFFESGNFDEAIKVGEDVEFFRRLGRLGKIKYVGKTLVYVSARRLNMENHFVFALKCLIWGILRLFGSKINILSYKWHAYSDYFYNKETDIVDGLKEAFSEIDKNPKRLRRRIKNSSERRPHSFL